MRGKNEEMDLEIKRLDLQIKKKVDAALSAKIKEMASDFSEEGAMTPRTSKIGKQGVGEIPQEQNVTLPNTLVKPVSQANEVHIVGNEQDMSIEESD